MAGDKKNLCIVGGGPAGMMAGLLFARAGVRTTVLEKHSISSATSGATRFIPPRCGCSQNSACWTGCFSARTTR